MIIRPDARLSGEQAQALGMEELQGMRLMRQAMDEAGEQVSRNMEILNRRSDNLRLRGYAVVSLRFERIWWEEIVMG